MRTINLKKSQIEFLFNNITDMNLKDKCLFALRKRRLYKKDYPTSSYLLEITDSEKVLFLDELTFLLTAIGLEDKNEINEKGIFIEDLITLFSR